MTHQKQLEEKEVCSVKVADDLTRNIAADAGIKFWEGTYIQEAVIAAKKSRADFEAVVNKYNDNWQKSKSKLSQ